jgi:hypothetical protein
MAAPARQAGLQLVLGKGLLCETKFQHNVNINLALKSKIAKIILHFAIKMGKSMLNPQNIAGKSADTQGRAK